MNELQKIWVDAYQSYLEDCKSPPYKPIPSTVDLDSARKHADRVLESLMKLQQEE